MRRLSIVTLLAMGCLSSAAEAEFSLQATPSSPFPWPASRPSLASHPQASSERTRTVVASGFGHEVPLRFAVRQLLPKNWRIRYGQGVDPDRLVQAAAAPGEAYVVQITR